MFVLSLHFFLLLVYRQGIAPKSKLDFYSLAYVYPFFQQSWQLFAPPPNSNYHLYVAFEKDALMQEADIYEEILSQHQSNRCKGYEPLLIAFTNSIHYFEKNTPLLEALNGPLKDDLYFNMLKHSTLNYLKYKYGSKVNMKQLILLVENVKTKERRAYFDQFF
ncbi:MAG: DUF5819 family protein [bacterium]|nr:DUF5819 family protein [bacterium]